MRSGDDRNHVRWLAPAQVALIVSCLDSPFREMAHLAAVTAMRQSEIVSLQRGDIHLHERIISFTRNEDGGRS